MLNQSPFNRRATSGPRIRLPSLNGTGGGGAGSERNRFLDRLSDRPELDASAFEAQMPTEASAQARNRAQRAQSYSTEMGRNAGSQMVSGGAFGSTAAALQGLANTESQVARQGALAADGIVEGDIAQQLGLNQFNARQRFDVESLERDSLLRGGGLEESSLSRRSDSELARLALYLQAQIAQEDARNERERLRMSETDMLMNARTPDGSSRFAMNPGADPRNPGSYRMFNPRAIR